MVKLSWDFKERWLRNNILLVRLGSCLSNWLLKAHQTALLSNDPNLKQAISLMPKTNTLIHLLQTLFRLFKGKIHGKVTLEIAAECEQTTNLELTSYKNVVVIFYHIKTRLRAIKFSNPRTSQNCSAHKKTSIWSKLCSTLNRGSIQGKAIHFRLGQLYKQLQTSKLNKPW